MTAAIDQAAMQVILKQFREMLPRDLAQQVLGSPGPGQDIVSVDSLHGEVFDTEFKVLLDMQKGPATAAQQIFSIIAPARTVVNIQLISHYVNWFDERGMKPTEDYTIATIYVANMLSSTHKYLFLFRKAEHAVEFRLTFEGSV